MEPVGVLRNLKPEALLLHGIILDHDSLFLHTEDHGEGRADPAIRALPTMLVLPTFVEMFDGPAHIAGLIQGPHRTTSSTGTARAEAWPIR